MPKGLKRYYGQGQLHFITFSCYRRLPLLATVEARNFFVEELGKVRREYGFYLIGYVVMLNHVHLLISEPEKGTPSTVMKMLKQQVSRGMRKRRQAVPKTKSGPIFPRFVAELPSFWQERFYDFNVYSHEKKKEKLEYMHANPVNRGLVKHPKDWAWSSFLFYAKDEAGLVEIDAVDL